MTTAQRTLEQARRKAFAADERRANPTRPLLSLTPDDVLAWSSTLGLPDEITTALAARAVDGKQLAQLTKEQLREGVLTDGTRMKLGHVHKLLQGIRSLAAEGWSSVLALDELDNSVNSGAVDKEQQGALLSEMGGEEEAAADDSEFGLHLSHWANGAQTTTTQGPTPEVSAPSLAQIRADRHRDAAAAAEPDTLPASRLATSEMAAADSWPVPVSATAPGLEPEPEPERELEVGAKARLKEKPSTRQVKYSLDYSRFDLDDSNSDDEDKRNMVGSAAVRTVESATTASASDTDVATWAGAEAALLKARPLQPLTEMHVALGAVPPPVAAQTIVDSLKSRGVCACDAGADPALLQASLREALQCMQAQLLHSPISGTERAVAEGATGVSVLTTSAPGRTEATARNPVLLELEEKVEALAMGESAH